MILLDLMNLITIKYDIEKDLQNYNYSFLNRRFPDYGRGDFDTAPNLWPNIKKEILEASENEKLGIIKEHLISNFYHKKVTDLSVESLISYWSTIESAYFEKLCKFMGIKNKIPKMNVYITTLDICPYNTKEKYFYIPFFVGLAIQTKVIIHESMHIVFFQNYEDYMVNKGINKQGMMEIAEALVALLNLEFKEFLLSPDYNKKPTTKDLQDEVVELYQQNKSFKEILDRLIELRTT